MATTSIIRSTPGPFGAAEYQDVLAGGRYLAALPEVDPKKVGIWGGSYGGYLTALALARNSDVFAAGVDLHGVHDWVSDVRELFAPPGLAVRARRSRQREGRRVAVIARLVDRHVEVAGAAHPGRR